MAMTLKNPQSFILTPCFIPNYPLDPIGHLRPPGKVLVFSQKVLHILTEAAETLVDSHLGAHCRTYLLQVLHHKGELLYISLVALLPRLLLLATSVPAQALNDVMCDRRAAIVLGSLPGQSHGGLGHQVYSHLGGGVRRV